MRGPCTRDGLQQAAIKTAEDIATADNTASVVTIPLVTDAYHVIVGIQLSYDAAPTGGLLTIAFGASPTTVHQLDITAAGPHSFEFGLGVHNADANHRPVVNEQCVITLAAGGAAVGSELNVQYV